MNWRGGWWLDCAPKTLTVQSGVVSAAGSKLYFETTVTHTYVSGFDAAWVGFGICGASASLTNTGDWGSNLAQAAAAFISGNNSNGIGTGGSMGYPTKPDGVVAAGLATFAMAINTSTKKLWFRNVTGSGNWVGSGTGDPAAGTNGFDYSGVIATGDIYAFVGVGQRNNTNYGAGTINFGASAFAGTVPSGYSAWGSSDFLNPSDNSDLTLSGGNLAFSASGLGDTSNIGHICRSYGHVRS